jgi:hypothetical protein
VASKNDEMMSLEQHLRRLIRAEDEATAARIAAATWLERRMNSQALAANGPHSKAPPVPAKPAAAVASMSEPSLDIGEVEIEASEVMPARQTERP